MLVLCLQLRQPVLLLLASQVSFVIHERMFPPWCDINGSHRSHMTEEPQPAKTVPNKATPKQRMLIVGLLVLTALIAYAMLRSPSVDSHELDGNCISAGGLMRYEGVLTNTGKNTENFVVRVRFHTGNRTTDTDVEYLNGVAPDEEREFEALGRGDARGCSASVES